MNDKAGREIYVGSYVVYSAGYGSHSNTLRYGKVTGINPKTITVRGVDDIYGKSSAPTLQKSGTLRAPLNHVLVIPAECLSVAAFHLLENL